MSKAHHKQVFMGLRSHATVEDGIVNNQDDILHPFVVLTTDINYDGFYAICWNYIWSLDSNNGNFKTEIHVGGASIYSLFQSPVDIAGSGIELPQVGGGTWGTGTDQRYPGCGRKIVELTKQTDLDIELMFTGDNPFSGAAMYQGQVSIERWDI